MIVRISSLVRLQLLSVLQVVPGLQAGQSYGRTQDGGASLAVLPVPTPSSTNAPPRKLPYYTGPIIFIDVTLGEQQLEAVLCGINSLETAVGGVQTEQYLTTPTIMTSSSSCFMILLA